MNIAATKEEVKSVLIKNGFVKVSYRPIWTKGDYRIEITKSGNGYYLYYNGKRINGWLIFHSWNNFVKFKNDLRDICGG